MLDRPSDLAVYTIELEAEPETEIVLPGLRLDYLSDGTRTIRGIVMNTAHLVDPGFFFMIDPILGTYSAFKLSPVSSEVSEPHYSAALREPLPTTIFHDPEECPACPNPCDGEWTSTLETWDPALIVLTRTVASGFWYEYGILTSKLRASGVGTCWSANPSALGTHWITSGCGWTSPTTFVDINVVGSYYNYDFGLPSVRADVNQSIRIQLNGGVVITFSHNDSGEASSLIFGVYSQQGHNNCF